MSEQLVWARVVRPRIPLVYLDINHYIYLARTVAGDPRVPHGYAALLDSARIAATESRALFPLSESHLWEMSAIQDPKQRQNIAAVMEELSGFHYLLGRPGLAQLEIEAGIEDLFDEKPPLPPLPLIRPTFAWAFGLRGGMTIRDDDGNDATHAARRDMGDVAYDAFIRDANQTVERGMLEGPTDEEVAKLRTQTNYAPEVARDSHQSRLDYELDLSARLQQHPEWRRGRLRDVVSAREVAHEWLDAINRVNEDRVRDNRRPLALNDEDGARRVMAAMPHNQVAISLKTRYHRDPAHKWTTNDITDIDAISVAYAYCDAVFTDKAVRAALKDSRELRTIEGYLPRKPTDLAEWLDALPSYNTPDLLLPHPLGHDNSRQP